MTRRALVIGSAGQDGTLLRAHLSRRGYDIYRADRRIFIGPDGTSSPFDLSKRDNVRAVIAEIIPTHVFYLAAHHNSSQDQVGDDETLARNSFLTNTDGALSVLSALAAIAREARFFYASSSLVFGYPSRAPQNEDTPLSPACLYGASKTAAMHLVRFYRQEHGLFACSGILYNHESSLRPAAFISKRLVSGAVDAALGLSKRIEVGSLSALVDWGAAEDYVAAMEAILSSSVPRDYIVASGSAHSIADFASCAFECLGLDYRDIVVEVAGKLHRRPRAVPLIGDPSLLERETGWRRDVGFREMVTRMVQDELASRGTK